MEDTDNANPADAVREALAREVDNLRCGVEVLVWRRGLAQDRALVADLAQEIIQEVAMRALAAAPKYDPTRSAHAWLFGIAINVVRERLRSSRIEREHLDPLGAENEERDETNPDEVLSKVSHFAWHEPERLVELMDLVEERERAILRMRYVDLFDGRQIAATLGITEGAARVRLSRALQNLVRAYRDADETGGEVL